MRVVIIADTFPPLRTSGAVQLRDLSIEFARQGHETTMLVADPSIATRFAIRDFHSVTVARLKAPQTKDVNYARRTLAELAMPFAMICNFRASPLADRQFDAVIWYSPTIFLGPIVRWLKKRGAAKSYLILRDIFPQWAADMGIISRGPIFRFLDSIANYQYRSADIIGVQTHGNLAFFAPGAIPELKAKLEVLHNWLADEPDRGCRIDIGGTCLAGRCIFVYAGNMGAAQHMDKLVNIAIALRNRADIGFLFVGRGSEVERLRGLAMQQELTNILFEDEIDPAEIPGLYAQCHVGMICLDGRHKTHNIPGKFLSYMQAGLPVLASVNEGNDLITEVEANAVGLTSVDSEGSDLASLAARLASADWAGPAVKERCRTLSRERFSVEAAVNHIFRAVSDQIE
jgi:glycosyltransferase involved in cell wall biosynthesis